MNDFIIPIDESKDKLNIQVSKRDIEKSLSKIVDLCGKEAVRRRVQNGGKLSKADFRNSNLKRSLFQGVRFIGCDFTEASATGVIWHDSVFLGCVFDRADFEYADLSRSKISSLHNQNKKNKQPSTIIGAGFNGAVLRNSEINDLDTQGSSFAHADFTESIIADCNLNGTYEGCSFEKVILKNVSFTDSNIDFADFLGASFQKVDFYLMDIPYVLGLRLDNILDNPDSIQISTNKGYDSSKFFDFSKLSSLKEDLAIFYISRNELFAVANLYLMFCDYDKFLLAFIDGAKQALLEEDYRTLTYLCKLIRRAEDSTNKFGPARLRQMYEMITNRVSISRNPSIHNQYKLHDGQIRNYLLSADNNNLTIYFLSNTLDYQNANRIASIVLNCIKNTCMDVGIDIRIVSSSFSIYSNPRHVIEINIIQVNLEKFTKKPPEKSHWNSFSRYMAVVATISMLFAGTSLFLNVSRSEIIPEPTTTVKQLIIDSHKEISNNIVSNSYVLKQGFKTVAKTENDTVHFYLDEQNIVENNFFPVANNNDIDH